MSSISLAIFLCDDSRAVARCSIFTALRSFPRTSHSTLEIFSSFLGDNHASALWSLEPATMRFIASRLIMQRAR